MTAPALMLLLLTAPWLVATLRAQPEPRRERAGRFGIMAMFVFTGAAHFTSTETMLALVPPSLPYPLAIVYVSGAVEIVLALLVTVPERQELAGRALVSLLLAFVPLNIYGAIYAVPSGGHAWGPAYLLLRLPLQAFLVWWVYRFTLRPDPNGAA